MTAKFYLDSNETIGEGDFLRYVDGRRFSVCTSTQDGDKPMRENPDFTLVAVVDGLPANPYNSKEANVTVLWGNRVTFKLAQPGDYQGFEMPDYEIGAEGFDTLLKNPF